MSRKVNIEITCDECDNDFDESDITVTPFRFGKTEVLLDLCMPCVLSLEQDIFAGWLALRPSTEPTPGKHSCTQCDRVFNTRGALGIHFTRIHGGTK